MRSRSPSSAFWRGVRQRARDWPSCPTRCAGPSRLALPRGPRVSAGRSARVSARAEDGRAESGRCFRLAISLWSAETLARVRAERMSLSTSGLGAPLAWLLAGSASSPLPALHRRCRHRSSLVRHHSPRRRRASRRARAARWTTARCPRSRSCASEGALHDGHDGVSVGHRAGVHAIPHGTLSRTGRAPGLALVRPQPRDGARLRQLPQLRRRRDAARRHAISIRRADDVRARRPSRRCAERHRPRPSANASASAAASRSSRARHARTSPATSPAGSTSTDVSAPRSRDAFASSGRESRSPRSPASTRRRTRPVTIRPRCTRRCASSTTTAAEIRRDAERAGTWESMHLWIVSDHGHSPVDAHDDLATLLRSWGHATIAHPWTFARRTRRGGDGERQRHGAHLSRARPTRASVVASARAAMVGRSRSRCSSDRRWTCSILPHSTTLFEVRQSRARHGDDRGARTARYSYRPDDGRSARDRTRTSRSATPPRTTSPIGIRLSRCARADRASRERVAIGRDHSLRGAGLGFSRAVRADSARVVARRAASRAHARSAADEPAARRAHRDERST